MWESIVRSNTGLIKKDVKGGFAQGWVLQGERQSTLVEEPKALRPEFPHPVDNDLVRHSAVT
ncbi:MAG: hypothetical protein QOE96_1949 [Blastocatellia bacterium]|jgi:hypothetical protein|nr:hypothetical protein [Blastocatellia bacterium]